MNIVSMGMKYFGPAIATKVASMLGVKSPMVAQIVAAALPTVLAMLTGKAASGQGAQALMSAVQGQSDLSPDGMGDLLAQNSPEQLAASGGGLSDLLGGDMDTLVGALGKFGGLPESSTKSVLGMIGPAALGSLKSQVSEQGLDAGGLASMLASQKDNIAQSVPQEFASQLKGTGLLSAIEGNMPAAAAAVPEAASSGGMGGLLKYLLPIAAVVIGAFYFLGGSEPEVPAVPDLSEMSVGDVNVGEQFTGVVDGLTGTLGGITDVDSATAALPDLEAASGSLDQITDLAGQLPEAAQTGFSGIVATALSSLQPTIEGLLGSSEYGAMLQPILEPLLGKLAGLAG